MPEQARTEQPAKQTTGAAEQPDGNYYRYLLLSLTIASVKTTYITTFEQRLGRQNDRD